MNKCDRCDRIVEVRFGVCTREVRVGHLYRISPVLCELCLQRLKDTVQNFLDKKAKTY